MFKVITRDYTETFERWTDALEQANSLKPQCKNWLQDVRILDEEELVWIYSRSHRYPQYIGAGTYDRLARLFIFEAMLEQELQQDLPATSADTNSTSTPPTSTPPQSNQQATPQDLDV